MIACGRRPPRDRGRCAESAGRPDVEVGVERDPGVVTTGWAHQLLLRCAAMGTVR